MLRCACVGGCWVSEILMLRFVHQCIWCGTAFHLFLVNGIRSGCYIRPFLSTFVSLFDVYVLLMLSEGELFVRFTLVVCYVLCNVFMFMLVLVYCRLWCH